MSGKKALMASAGLRDDDGCIHATSRKALKTRRLQKQTSSMHAIPSRSSNGVVLEKLVITSRGIQDDLWLRLGGSRRNRSPFKILLWGLGRWPLVVDKTDFATEIHVDLAEAKESAAGWVPLAIELAAGIARDHLPDLRGLLEP